MHCDFFLPFCTVVTSRQPDQDVILLINQFVSTVFSICGELTGLATFCYINDIPCVDIDTCEVKREDGCTIFKCTYNRSETVNGTFKNLKVLNSSTLKEVKSLSRNFTIQHPSEGNFIHMSTPHVHVTHTHTHAHMYTRICTHTCIRTLLLSCAYAHACISKQDPQPITFSRYI